MKKLNNLKFILFALTVGFALASCTKGFEAKNQNPYSLSSLDPALLFTNAEVGQGIGSYEGEQTISQQTVNAYDLGATEGFNFNKNNDNYNNGRWNAEYGTPLKNIEQILFTIKGDATHANLNNMARILRVYCYMTLVDNYGDVPYSQAGKAYTGNILNPAYDKMSDIYGSLYSELHTAVPALSNTNEYVGADIFFGGTGGNVNTQVTEWKRFGYSLMLRLGMRYSKLDQAKAQSIAQEAFAGGVMQSTADNVYVGYNAVNTNGVTGGIRTTNPYYYYIAQPFATQLTSTNDPRTKYIAGVYANPNVVNGTLPDTITSHQFGFPVGYDQTSVQTAPGYRGQNVNKNAGQNYSQPNYNVMFSATAPFFIITHAQTQLLLAEAAFRGWITGGLTAAQYYNAGVQAAMDDFKLYPNAAAIPLATENSYLAQPSVVYNAANALKLINTQYWIASFSNGPETWANVRRSGFPALSPNLYNNLLGGDFVHRMAYPVSESSNNSANYQAAVASMGGSDNLTARVFWDK